MPPSFITGARNLSRYDTRDTPYMMPPAARVKSKEKIGRRVRSAISMELKRKPWRRVKYAVRVSTHRRGVRNSLCFQKVLIPKQANNAIKNQKILPARRSAGVTIHEKPHRQRICICCFICDHEGWYRISRSGVEEGDE